MVGQTVDNKQFGMLLKGLSITGGVFMVLLGILKYAFLYMNREMQYILSFYYM